MHLFNKQILRLSLLAVACSAMTACTLNLNQTSKQLPASTEAPIETPAAVQPQQAAKANGTLLSRTVVTPPQFHHPAVSAASIQAVKNAILALPAPLRDKLDHSEARVIISPNMTDRWPNSMKDLPNDEKSAAPTLAELPGRIYGLDMCVYERPKKRGTTNLGPARAPAYTQLQVGDMCFQVLDDMMTFVQRSSTAQRVERRQRARDRPMRKLKSPNLPSPTTGVRARPVPKCLDR